jgi:hypothetical protein
MVVALVTAAVLWLGQDAFRQQLHQHARAAVKQIERSGRTDWWFGR